jgi:hypothetical protein
LTTIDKTRLHGYWVPCRAAIEEAKEEEDSDDDEAAPPKNKGIYPTMIFCNPNAGYAEYFQY